MTDQTRWEDDRSNDRSRQDDGAYRTGESYGRSQGQDRYPDRDNAARTYQGAAYQGGRGERFGQGYRSYEGGPREDRSFNRPDYDPYGAGYGGYGEDSYRAERQGPERYGRRETSGGLLHQGYQAPFGAGEQDRNDFRAYGSNPYAERGYGRRSQGADYGPVSDRGFWAQTRDEVASWFGDDEAARRRRQDETLDAQHRGRGPKGYVRSDDRIREDAHDRLTDDYLLDASDIEVKVDQGEVTLSGHVSSRSDKRRAEDVIDGISGVKHVQNNLRVKDRTTNAGSTYGASGVSTTSTPTTTGAGKATN